MMHLQSLTLATVIVPKSVAAGMAPKNRIHVDTSTSPKVAALTHHEHDTCRLRVAAYPVRIDAGS